MLILDSMPVLESLPVLDAMPVLDDMPVGARTSLTQYVLKIAPNLATFKSHGWGL